jgi:hypothetical protein
MSATGVEIYYLPGRGGRVDAGLGQELKDRGYSVTGRQLDGDFQRLKFSEQVNIVAGDIKAHFWRDDALVIANSFGAYLFLHAQIISPPFPGKALLLSPILGASRGPGNGPGFSPPWADRLITLAEAGELHLPSRCEIHVGEFDWQSNPPLVSRFGNLLGVSVSIVPQGTHNLAKEYVASLLDAWLPTLER